MGKWKFTERSPTYTIRVGSKEGNFEELRF